MLASGGVTWAALAGDITRSSVVLATNPTAAAADKLRNSGDLWRGGRHAPSPRIVFWVAGATHCGKLCIAALPLVWCSGDGIEVVIVQW